MDKRISILKKIIISGVIFGFIDTFILLLLVIVEISLEGTFFGFSMSLVFLALFSTIVGLFSYFLLKKKIKFSAWLLLIAALGILISSSFIGIIPFLLFVAPSLYIIISWKK